MKIIIDDKIPYIKGALDAVAEVVYIPGTQITQSDLMDADAMIIRTRTKCNARLLDGTSVKFIATATIGYDHIDTNYCSQHGIHWTNAPGCNAASVEQYIVSVLLYLAVKFAFRIKNTTLGIIGVGNVGSKVARAAKALGCKVLLNDPPRERKEAGDGYSSLDEVLAGSDIVTMHVPLNEGGEDRTLGLADRKFFERMKKGAFFINTSRGEVVDETALKQALSNGKLAGAVLDVYREEPNIDKDLLDMLTLATPHIAGYSADGKANGSRMSVDAVNRHFALGIEHWKPTEVPEPENPEIYVDGGDTDEQNLIREAYNQTYDVFLDHQMLLEQKDSFEKLRGNYDIRREPGAYHIKVFNDDGKYRTIFENLGFSVLGDSCM